jgi:hypothetical protein
MIDTSVLGRVAAEGEILLIADDVSPVTDLALGWAQSGLTVRFVRGNKMRHYQPLYDEFAAALQFPWYFGENANAFDECISDLSWLPRGGGYVIVITHPNDVLIDTDDDGLGWLVRLLSRAAATWATPIERGEWWDRPAVPFHIVLQCGAEDSVLVHQRWTAAGAHLLEDASG